MYPSGKWVCVWELDGQREIERGLSLTFEAGRVSGTGTDVDGRFEYEGGVDSAGALRLFKHYISGPSEGATFVYHGRHDGEGVIAGDWHQQGFPVNRGEFELRPWDGREPVPVKSSCPAPLEEPDDDAEEERAERLMIEIIDNGECVFRRDWDGGGPGSSGTCSCYKHDGKFAITSLDYGQFGPFDSLEEALEDEHCNLLAVGSAWHEFTCKSMTAAELAARLRWFGEDDQELLINGEAWVYRKDIGLVRAD